MPVPYINNNTYRLVSSLYLIYILLFPKNRFFAIRTCHNQGGKKKGVKVFYAFFGFEPTFQI